MWGAIIGDIVGSIYEVLEVKAKKEHNKRSYEERMLIMDNKTPLFTSDSSYTDDTVLTLAIGDAIMHDKDYEKYLRTYGQEEVNLGIDKYGRSRFSYNFCEWLKQDEYGHSIGNGCAMRVGPIGYAFDELLKVEQETRLSTLPTHNNNECVDAACTVASAIYLARHGLSKEQIMTYLSFRYHYRLEFNLDDLRHNYTFKSAAIDSVPQAIYCFLVADSFEDGLRKSISIGGDSDTIAAITCSILEAYYGVPKELIEEAKKYLNSEQLNVINQFYNMLKTKDKEKKIKYETNS